MSHWFWVGALAIGLVGVAACVKGARPKEDPFPPRMPQIAPHSSDELRRVFQRAFSEAADGVVVVTPERSLWTIAKTPMTAELETRAAQLSAQVFGAERNMRVVAVANTDTRALEKNENFGKAIPFLGHLIALASRGHRVVVFEGDRAAFAAAVEDADLLLVDDGMQPFLQPDWFAVAHRTMKPGGRVVVHRRADYKLVEMKSKLGEWMITDDSPGLAGQSARNYSNVLLTLLAEGPVKSAVVATNRELPSLLEIAAGDAKRLDGFATFSLAEANAGRPFIIGLLIGLTGYKGPDDAFVDGTLPSVVFGPGGSKREVRLRLHQAKIGDEIELTITAP